MLTNTLPRFIYGKLDTNEYNFRVFRTRVYEAIRGTKCDSEPWHGKHNGDHSGEHSGEHYGDFDIEYRGEPDFEKYGNQNGYPNYHGDRYGVRNGFGQNRYH